MLRSSFTQWLWTARGRYCSIAKCSTVSRGVDYYIDVSKKDIVQFGDFKQIASNSITDREYCNVENIGSDIMPEENIWVRGRMSNIRRKGNACFAVIRSKSYFTLQLCCFAKSDDDVYKDMINFVNNIPMESIVDVYGKVQSAHVKSCTQKQAELLIQKIFVVSRAPVVLPFSVEDASRCIIFKQYSVTILLTLNVKRQVRIGNPEIHQFQQ